MKKHNRGELLEKAVRGSGMSISQIARLFGCSQRQMYNYFEKQDLSIEVLFKFGNIIHHDFTKDLGIESPEIKAIIAEEPSNLYGKSNLERCLDEKNEWMKKYFDITERYIALLESNKPQKK